MKSLTEIKKTIESDLANFESMLQEEIYTDDELLGEKISYLFKSKGKRIRPTLVFLFSRLFGSPDKQTYNSALIIEILHTATLIHDDVVDNANLRRGQKTFNRRWDNKNAVLIGDYLFAKSMNLISKNSAYDIFKFISPVLVELSYGELEQLRYNKNDYCTYEEYFEIINKKTASLISASCVTGAFTGGANSKQLEVVENFGRIIGQMFQIGDDILDYNGNSQIGKDSGNDIEERKMTLPLILAMKNATDEEKKFILSIWSHESQISNEVEVIKNFTNKNNGIKEAEKILLDLGKKAHNLLLNFDKSNYREALEAMISIIASRKK